MSAHIFVIYLTVFSSLLAQDNAKSLLASKNKENYQDIIKKAQDLTLSQNTEQAIQLLNRAIKKEANNRKARNELIRLLDDITTTFHAEKTQKIFEYAKSLLRESPQESIEKLAEVSALEPTNILPYIQSARGFLLTGRCERAEEMSQKIEQINGFNNHGRLIWIQIKTCLQKNQEIDDRFDKLMDLNKEFPLYLHVSLAQHFYNKQDYLRAQVELQKATTKDASFPEIYYWESQVQSKLNANPKQAALRYVRLCKTLTKKDYKKYELEPRLCLELKNIESVFKNEIESEEKREI